MLAGQYNKEMDTAMYELIVHAYVSTALCEAGNQIESFC